MNYIPFLVNSEDYVTDGAQFMVRDTQPVETFSITLYSNIAEPNRVDKSSMLSYVGELTGTLREECSIVSPSILIEMSTLPTFNYVFIVPFNRYYFVRSITSVRTNLWRVDLDVDVLYTYRTSIQGLDAYIARQEFDYNDELVDTQLPCEKQSEIYVFDPSGGYDTGTFDNQLADGAHNFVLTVVGA